jgi:hypothetical protein
VLKISLYQVPKRLYGFILLRSEMPVSERKKGIEKVIWEDVGTDIDYKRTTGQEGVGWINLA